MKYGNRYPRWKKVLSSPITVVFFMLLAILLFRAVTNMGDKVDKIEQKMTNADLEYKKLQEREVLLKNRVDFLSTDEGVETELRSKYKAVYEGEKVAVIIDDKKSTSSPTSTVGTNISWWNKLLALIGL